MNANIVSHNFSFVNLFVNENSNISRKFSKIFHFPKNFFARFDFFACINATQSAPNEQVASPPTASRDISTKGITHVQADILRICRQNAPRPFARGPCGIEFSLPFIIIAYKYVPFSLPRPVSARPSVPSHLLFMIRKLRSCHIQTASRTGKAAKCNLPLQKFQCVFHAPPLFCVRVA